MAKFITLAGRKQVGKDTSAQFIKTLLEHRNVHVVHFADALKKACHLIFGIPLEDMESETGKQKLTDVLWPNDYREDYTDPGGMKPLGGVWVPHIDVMQVGLGRKYMTVREVLQFVGTDLFRHQLDPDIWIKSVYRKKYLDDDIVVVADCRFPNEARFAKERGTLISVERNTQLESDGHVSENALGDYNDYDHVIDNNGSFSDLRSQISSILSQTDF